jgi:hypothetical protein
LDEPRESPLKLTATLRTSKRPTEEAFGRGSKGYSRMDKLELLNAKDSAEGVAILMMERRSWLDRHKNTSGSWEPGDGLRIADDQDRVKYYHRC